LNLRLFSAVNRRRCESAEGFGHALASWSPAEWTNAMAGEAGEACNVTKKILRHRDGVAGNVKPGDQDLEELKRKAAREICDAIIYADLAIQALGFETSDVLAEVFNTKSAQLGCPVVFPASPSPDADGNAHPEEQQRQGDVGVSQPESHGLSAASAVGRQPDGGGENLPARGRR
jgi:hypothetical protein